APHTASSGVVPTVCHLQSLCLTCHSLPTALPHPLLTLLSAMPTPGRTAPAPTAAYRSATSGSAADHCLADEAARGNLLPCWRRANSAPRSGSTWRLPEPRRSATQKFPSAFFGR